MKLEKNELDDLLNWKDDLENKLRVINKLIRASKILSLETLKGFGFELLTDSLFVQIYTKVSKEKNKTTELILLNNNPNKIEINIFKGQIIDKNLIYNKEGFIDSIEDFRDILLNLQII